MEIIISILVVTAILAIVYGVSDASVCIYTAKSKLNDTSWKKNDKDYHVWFQASRYVVMTYIVFWNKIGVKIYELWMKLIHK